MSFTIIKKQGVPLDALKGWVEQSGWEALVNRKGTTWRKLTPEQQAAVVDTPSALALMAGAASVIKRPVVVKGQKVVALGFNADEWGQLFL